MAAFRGILAIGIWFLCIRFSVYCYTPFPEEMNSVLDALVEETSSTGYNLYAQSTDSGQGCYGHFVCDRLLSRFICHPCLQNVRVDLINGRPSNTGAQVHLVDCRMRYKNYQFTK
ncbi:hypothetical protein ACJRO7_025968 [Eucalyptus globulus]|uniref:Gnk2-homologous domain-containing protein n=1 Tax=Eucalyptus globulus TaxID=34317 RepID=A0ABD3KBV5_EUCGL